jgi:hypothetical protein
MSAIEMSDKIYDEVKQYVVDRNVSVSQGSWRTSAK